MSGRPRKQGLDYFSMDCHMDDKIKLIEAEFGLKGFAIIVKLFQKIYGEFGYYCEWNNDTALLFARENLSSCDAANLINEVVSALIRRNIFSEELYHNYNILTSQGVQKRYMEAVSRRDEVILIKEYLLISVDKNVKNVVINSINVDSNQINVVSNKQSKGKESRVNKSKVIKDSDSIPIDYKQIVEMYNSNCQSLPKCTKLTDARKTLIKSRLKTYSLAEMQEAFSLAENSDFLSGRNGKWNGASFDWVLNANNIQKILEGNYKNKTDNS